MPSASEVAERLREAPARIAGAGTKPWGPPVEANALSTEGLGTFEHEPGDFTAVLGAGLRLRDVQERLAEKKQMLALDPPDGTIGGVFATADSGPLRHRYGAPRDLAIGVMLALSDGTVAHGGGRVIKNVAGYDLPKLASGSFGTLGVICEVCVRLHPRPDRTATAVIRHDDPLRLQQTALDLAHRPLEAESLDVRWADGEGAILARFAGAAAVERAEAVGDTVADDEQLWAAQRDAQRGEHVARVAGLPADLARVLEAARDLGATAVGRAGVGTTWLSLPPGTDVDALRERLAPHPVITTDDPLAVAPGPERDLMLRVKERFDPSNHCNPGLFA